MARLHRLYREQILPIDLEGAWTFFSNPANLSTITPEWLNFQILTPLPPEMYAGLLIEYRISIPPGLPTTWITEITQVRKPYFFVDNQRVGPYRLWHHQHRFEEVNGGVRMEDIVDYILPFEPIGSLLIGWWIKRKLNEIFEFRCHYLAKYAQNGRIARN